MIRRAFKRVNSLKKGCAIPTMWPHLSLRSWRPSHRNLPLLHHGLRCHTASCLKWHEHKLRDNAGSILPSMALLLEFAAWSNNKNCLFCKFGHIAQCSRSKSVQVYVVHITKIWALPLCDSPKSCPSPVGFVTCHTWSL